MSTKEKGSSETEAEYLLSELVNALEGAFISVWQSTHAWQNQLDDARAWLNQQEENRNG